jgi:hypothetical protein
MNSHGISSGVSRRFLGSVDRNRELHGGFPAGAVKLPRIPGAVLPGANCEKVVVHRRTMRSAAIKCQRHDSMSSGRVGPALFPNRDGFHEIQGILARISDVGFPLVANLADNGMNKVALGEWDPFR